MVGAEGLGDGDGGWGWVGVLGVSKIYKKWGMGVGGWGNNAQNMPEMGVTL